MGDAFGNVGSAEIQERWRCFVIAYRQLNRTIPLGFHSFSSDKGDLELATGYHGEMAIDPATSTILSMTVEADLGFETSRILRGDIMVADRAR